MICKVIKYTDYNDVEREEKFWFNLSKSELTRMQMSEEGSFSERLQDIVKAKDIHKMMEFFEWIIQKSYGEKSPDGKRFIKTPEATQAFIESPAYDELYFSLLQEPQSFAAFVNSLVPKELAQDLDKIQVEAHPQ